MPGFSDYGRYDAIGLAELVARREVSPQELLEEAIARTLRVDDKINAVVVRHFDEARAAVGRGLPEAVHPAPFRGVPFLLKDLQSMAGTRTTFGSRMFADYVAPHDTTLTARYKAAGLVVFGKTNTPEFGQTATTEPKLHGPTRNPWNTEHTAGGSSGGAAAAVAAGILPIANASDGGGSIRGPASACGVFGLKPTRARVPAGPDRGEGWGGLSINHAVSRTVRDSAALLDAVIGGEPGDPYTAPPPERPYAEEVKRDPGRLRIAFSVRSPIGTPVDAECVAAVTNTARLLERLGHHVEEAAPKLDAESLARTITAFMSPNVRISLEDRAKALGRPLARADVEAVTWRAHALGARLTAEDYVRATTIIHQAGRTMAAFHERYDVIVEPTYGHPPPKLGYLDMDSDDNDTYLARIVPFTPFTSRYNMTGQPSMSVPLHWSADGLPVGVMFSARHGDEATLFRLAAQLEAESPWAQKRPPISA